MSRLLLHKLIFLTFCFLFFQNTYAQEHLVKDINPGLGWSDIDFKFRIGNNFYFVASGDTGNELWTSDGTADGTLVLKDINPGAFVDSNPSNFINYNGVWYFTADDGVNGIELWKTDGTSDGTVLFKEINSGTTGSDPSNFSILNGTLYFSANDGINGNELWKTDGTAVGTVMVSDIYTGASGSNPESIVALGNDIVFVANDGINGKELWKTDGTSGGTAIIKDIYVGASSSFPTNLTSVSSKVYFTADNGINGNEVWSTDGTNSGTRLTTDIVSGAGHPQASDLQAVGNYLFFVGDNGTNGLELFRSNSNDAIPIAELVEIFPDTFGATPTNFIHLNGDLLFNANSGGIGYELWKANASDGSVTLVKDINPGFGSSSPTMLGVLNNDLIFNAQGDSIGYELWKTDGTETGTMLLGDLNTDPNADPNTNPSNSNPTLSHINEGVMYFTATDYINGFQVWRTNGTNTSTQRLTNIPHNTIFNNAHKPFFINSISNEIINFVGLTDDYGEELWGFEIDPVTISDLQTNSPLDCNGDTDGTIDISISGGLGDPSCFNYIWSDNNLSGLNLTGLSAGSYTLTVTDCVGFETISTIIIEEPVALSSVVTQSSEISCNGAADGQASIETTGGTSPYTYLWDNGETGQTAFELNAGTHNVTITDLNGCEHIGMVTLGEPTAINASITAGPGICNGASNGLATVNPTGGNSPYTYLWDSGETTETAISLNAGLHNVTITDASGCTFVDEVLITQLTSINIDFDTENVSCIDGSNGSSTAIPSGGSGSGYTYLWETGATTATITDLAPGQYCVTVMDDSGCSASDCTAIFTPLISASATGSVSCFGGMDGSASVTIFNENSTYTYIWDNGETGATANMLNAGDHMVTVTDLLNCSAVRTVTITEATEFVLADSASVSPTCFGDSNGSVTFNFSGGTLPYAYSWSTGAMTSTGTLDNLSGGATYCATVTDANNCSTHIFCSTLEEPELIVPNLSAMADATCFGICNGTATIAVSSGEPNDVYIFTWSSGEQGGGTSATAMNLCAGMNTVEIFDGACTVIDTFMIDEPTIIEPLIVVTDITCFGGADGSLIASAIGGTPGYSFEYSNGTSDLVAGEYTLTVTDDNSCQIVDTFTIAEPAEIMLSYEIETPSCIGEADGSVNIIASGGTGAFAFAYSNGSSDLAAGTYSVTVTDDNNCTKVDTFMIEDPTLIEVVNAVTDISCFGEMDGSVITTASGGAGSYTFEYSNGSSELGAGIYQVSVTDGNACMVIDTFTIIEPELLETDVFTTDISCNGLVDGMVEITASGGVMPYDYEYSGGTENLLPGLYTATTTDANGCIVADTFLIYEPAPLTFSFSITSPISCFGASDGELMLELSGGTAPYTYDSLYTDLSTEVFEIIFSDANGCGQTIPFSLTQPDEIMLTTSSTDATGSDADGTATVNPVGGVAPYTYQWNTNPIQTTQTATGLIAGDYEVTVTDDNGCESIIGVTVDMFVNTIELDESLRFDLYPNPANTNVVLDLKFLETRNTTLKIYDALGRLVYDRALGFVQKDQLILDLKDFNQGIYWIQLNADVAQYVKKLSVIKR